MQMDDWKWADGFLERVRCVLGEGGESVPRYLDTVPMYLPTRYVKSLVAGLEVSNNGAELLGINYY